MLPLLVFSAVLALSSALPCAGGSHSELLLSLNKKLLRSLENQEGPPNPSVHLALRLSDRHNLQQENQHLARLTSSLHLHLQSSLASGGAVVGLLALYTLALKSSCFDLNTVTFNISDNKETLLSQLKKQLEQEKEHISFSHRPLTNYYQYSLGVLALCVSGVRVNHHVTNKLVRAVQNQHFKHGDAESIDTSSMAGMSLQCVKDSGSVQSAADLQAALSSVRVKLLAARRADGHIGNEFSTGLAVQALLAMGTDVSQCAPSMEAMRTAANSNTYHNPMGVSQILPALQHTSYLSLRNKECLNEDDSLLVDPVDPVVVEVPPSDSPVDVMVEVVMSSGTSALYSVGVAKGSFLLDALRSLEEKNVGFTLEVESSLWGPFLSSVNGEQARQTDRRYWKLSSDGSALSQGVGDFKVEASQNITIQNTSY